MPRQKSNVTKHRFNFELSVGEKSQIESYQNLLGLSSLAEAVRFAVKTICYIHRRLEQHKGEFGFVPRGTYEGFEVFSLQVEDLSSTRCEAKKRLNLDMAERVLGDVDYLNGKVEGLDSRASAVRYAVDKALGIGNKCIDEKKAIAFVELGETRVALIPDLDAARRIKEASMVDL